MRVILVSLAFNLFWFAAVVGQNSLLPFLVLALIGAMFIDRGVIIAIPLFALIGIAGDTVLMRNQILNFDTAFLPLWLCLLWAGFGAYVWLLRDWLLDKNVGLLIAVGSLGGAASYLAGERFDAVQFGLPYWSNAMVIAAAWAIYSMVFLSLLKFFHLKGKTWWHSNTATIKK
ncbi:DUF2878 domain-containing protein [Enterovibrio sp. ZSDZ42]|uniref:DUF2878 domain-containing protein n=1 Tax=Enterovibrio gelatinilyticus TaxID=2899819 RepID=A0ABT5QW21_9GAMM|nr:DUF2878 domain-containing protein [Enterovibrio sp. ZSDZ42]MDD1792208.1 DUF2878 domain-containing protein [Enterovibrio sp. ZSDZ42]